VLLSTALCVPMAWILVGGLNAVAGLEAPVVIPGRWLGFTPLIAFGAALVAALLPAVRAAGQSPAAAVAYE
jgi:ABC-type lipoprotein release transport system permease subunit